MRAAAPPRPTVNKMRILEIIVDILLFLFEKLKELALFVLELVIAFLKKLYEKFDEVCLAEKVIFLNTITAFFAVVLPVAKFRIPAFRSDYYVNNPLAVYLVGIAILMFASLYFFRRWVHPVRVLLNAYYLFWVFYILLAEGLTRAEPHSICFGYYLNIAAPVVYMAASGAHWLQDR